MRIDGGRRGPWLCAAIVATVSAGRAAPASACSTTYAPPTALPRTGTTNVSTMSSIVVESSYDPAGALTLLANGAPVGALSTVPLGFGTDALPTGFWRLRIGAPGTDEPLAASTEYTLSGSIGPGGAPVELTRFTTAPGYDKDGGTNPVIRGLKLWRVRYPVKDIASGNCVFAEYHGFLTVDYQPATVPNTPADAVVHMFSLTPKTGGSSQHFVHVGATPFAGLAPAGRYPTPIGDWHPELDPTREYCLSIGAFGDGHRARPMLGSDLVCTTVTQLSAAGAPPPPSIDGSGCALAGQPTPLPAGVASLVALLAVARARWRRRQRTQRA